MAYVEAVKSLRASATRDEEKARLGWFLERAEASRHPVRLAPGDLERYAGDYGPRRVWVEGGQLRFAGEDTPPFLLTPLADRVFAADADETFRVEFVSGAGERMERMIVRTLDGQRWEYTRDR